MAQIQLGIDIGGTGIKGGVIDVTTGEFVADKIKIGTPSPAHPKDVAKVVNELIESFNWTQKIGFGFPAIVQHGICKSASNIPNSWIDVDLEKFFKKKTGLDCTFANDADVAGIAELEFGDYKNKDGSILLLTLGTGIGSAFMYNGQLIPNSEFGHLLYKDSIFEKYASNSARKKNDWSYDKWGSHLNALLNHIERILSPNLIILGGGISKKFDEFKHTIDCNTEIRPAQLQNNAGIIGAAVLARK